MIDGFEFVLREQLRQCLGLPESIYDLEFNVGGFTFSSMAVVAVTRRENYLADMFESVIVSVVITPSQYSEVILPAHEDLVVKLIERPATGGKAFAKQYRAIIMGHQDEKMEGNVRNVGEPGLADQMNVSVITFQLIPTAAYDLRLREVGGIFQDVSAADVLRYNLVNMRLRTSYELPEAVATVNIDSVESQRKFRAIMVPEGMPLMELPDYLQDNYGIFPTGMGCYLKGQSWYVFAPYNLAKHQEDVNKLVVFNAPASSYRSLEKNFYVDGRTMTIVATGDTTTFKNTDSEALNGGTGIRYGSLESIAGGVSSTDPTEDPVRKPKDYMTEYRSSSYASKYQKTVTAKERFSDNPLKHSSDLASRGGQVVTVTWEHGMLDPLFPGMPVTFYYGKDGKVNKKQGTLIADEMISNIPLKTFANPAHRKTVKLHIWLKNG